MDALTTDDDFDALRAARRIVDDHGRLQEENAVLKRSLVLLVRDLEAALEEITRLRDQLRDAGFL